MTEKAFASEADLVAAFCNAVQAAETRRNYAGHKWTAYHETSGWDLLLVSDTGLQIGIEAKLKLNPKVLAQALEGGFGDSDGPDHRAVLVPADGLQQHMAELARHLGITVITCRPKPPVNTFWAVFSPELPTPSPWLTSVEKWPTWCPAVRCPLPDYVPDVSGGHASPVALTDWKIKAIKLMILLERRGAVTRADMKALKISPTRWTDHWNGFLSPGPEGGYVRNGRTPDLKMQHPVNWGQIDADWETWSKTLPGRDLLPIETTP